MDPSVADDKVQVSTVVSRRDAFWPTVGWAALLFGLSSIPGHHIPAVGIISVSDKLVHGCVYAVLGALCFRSLTARTRIAGVRAVVVATAIALVYGISDEIHQLFVPQRSADLLDVVADAVGGSMGATVAYWSSLVRNRQPNTQPKTQPSTHA